MKFDTFEVCVRLGRMASTVSNKYKSELLKLTQQPTLQLALLSLQWPGVQSRFKRERLRLTRKIPANDPIRLGVNLLAPIDCASNETLHTRALSYLLDPSNPHGFNKHVLAGVIEKVKDVSPRGAGAAGLLALLRHKRTKVTVVPEYRWYVEDFKRSVARCDIWIELHAGGAAGLIIIENKIEASEAKDQLRWYETKGRAWYKQHSKAIAPLYVFLRPDKRKAKSSDSPWLSLSYIELASALRKAWLDNPGVVGREWLGLYIASVTSGVLKIDPDALGKAAIGDIDTYLCGR